MRRSNIFLAVLPQDAPHSRMIVDDKMKEKLGLHILRHQPSPWYAWATETVYWRFPPRPAGLIREMKGPQQMPRPLHA
jgi:hypothetical protein